MSTYVGLVLSYSIAQSVDDVKVVLDTLARTTKEEQLQQPQKVHLFCHSYGGCLGYEFAKQRPNKVKSLILSNAPTNMKKAGEAYNKMALKNPLGFWKQHVCQVQSPVLDDALRHVGHVWAGMDVVLDYVAIPPSTSSSLFPPRTLVITCAKDFGFESSQGWKDAMTAGDDSSLEEGMIEEICLDHCAHYPHLEDGPTLGRILDDFMTKHES